MRISLSKAWEVTKTDLARDGRLFIAVALGLLVLPGLLVDISMPEAAPGEMPPAGPWIAIGALSLILSFTGQLALIRLALKGGTSVREAIVHGFNRLLPYLGATLILFLPFLVAGMLLYTASASDPENPRLAPAAGLLLLALVALILFVRMSLLSSVASAEATGPLDVLKRSWELGRGNWWRLFAFGFLFGLVVIVTFAVVQTVIGSAVAASFGELKPWTVGTLIVSLIGQLVMAAIYIVFFVMLAHMYRQAAGGGAAEVSVPSSGT